MYEIYRQYRDRKGYKDSDVSKITGIPASTFSDWKSGRSKPNTEKLTKIAECLDTLVEYLDTPKGDIITCPDCGMTYSIKKNSEEHNKYHSAWKLAEKKFGTIYGNYAIREKIKARNRNIRDDKSLSLQERSSAELEVLRCLFSRSIGATNYDLRHVSYEDYVAMMLANKNYGPRLDAEIYQQLKNKFGELPGIDSGSYYHIPEDKPMTVAAHKDGENFTPEELEKIEEYKKLLIAARPKG